MGTTFYRVLAVVVLAAIAAHRFAAIRKPQGVEEYHGRVRDAAALVPRHIDGWVGQDIPVPARAIKVLDPNLMVSKRYVNVENGVVCGFVLVHCSDAHDMVGHYPLRCYPAQGWDVKAVRERDWVVGDLAVTGTEYEFVLPARGGTAERTMVVANCLLRPGRVLRDMSGLSDSIRGAGGQAMGAGQLQVYFEASVPPERRDAAVATLVQGYRPVLGAILAGTGRADN